VQLPQPPPALPEVTPPSEPTERKLTADINFSQSSLPQSGQTIFSLDLKTSSSKSRPQPEQWNS